MMEAHQGSGSSDRVAPGEGWAGRSLPCSVTHRQPAGPPVRDTDCGPWWAEDEQGARTRWQVLPGTPLGVLTEKAEACSMRPTGSQAEGDPAYPLGCRPTRRDRKRCVGVHAGGCTACPPVPGPHPQGSGSRRAPCPHPGLRPSPLGQCLPTPPATPGPRDFTGEELTAPHKGPTHIDSRVLGRGDSPGRVNLGPWKGPSALSPSARCLPLAKQAEGLTA